MRNPSSIGLGLAVAAIGLCAAAETPAPRPTAPPLGGPGSLWFPMIGTMVIAPASVSFRLRERIAVLLAWIVATVAGFCLLHPENWRDPLLFPSFSFVAPVAYCWNCSCCGPISHAL